MWPSARDRHVDERPPGVPHAKHPTLSASNIDARFFDTSRAGRVVDPAELVAADASLRAEERRAIRRERRDARDILREDKRWRAQSAIARTLVRTIDHPATATEVIRPHGHRAKDGQRLVRTGGAFAPGRGIAPPATTTFSTKEKSKSAATTTTRARGADPTGHAKKLETLPAGDPPNAIGALPVRFKVNTDEEYKLHVARRNVETRMEKERKLREALRASSSVRPSSSAASASGGLLLSSSPGDARRARVAAGVTNDEDDSDWDDDGLAPSTPGGTLRAEAARLGALAGGEAIKNQAAKAAAERADSRAPPTHEPFAATALSTRSGLTMVDFSVVGKRLGGLRGGEGDPKDVGRGWVGVMERGKKPRRPASAGDIIDAGGGRRGLRGRDGMGAVAASIAAKAAASPGKLVKSKANKAGGGGGSRPSSARPAATSTKSVTLSVTPTLTTTTAAAARAEDDSEGGKLGGIGAGASASASAHAVAPRPVYGILGVRPSSAASGRRLQRRDPRELAKGYSRAEPPNFVLGASGGFEKVIAGLTIRADIDVATIRAKAAIRARSSTGRPRSAPVARKPLTPSERVVAQHGGGAVGVLTAETAERKETTARTLKNAPARVLANKAGFSHSVVGTRDGDGRLVSARVFAARTPTALERVATARERNVGGTMVGALSSAASSRASSRPSSAASASRGTSSSSSAFLSASRARAPTSENVTDDWVGEGRGRAGAGRVVAGVATIDDSADVKPLEPDEDADEVRPVKISVSRYGSKPASFYPKGVLIEANAPTTIESRASPPKRFLPLEGDARGPRQSTRAKQQAIANATARLREENATPLGSIEATAFDRGREGVGGSLKGSLRGSLRGSPTSSPRARGSPRADKRNVTWG